MKTEMSCANQAELTSGNLGAVATFRRIKAETKCDDMVAAILTLAQRIASTEVWPKIDSDTGFELSRVGADIAEAISDVSRDGKIQVKLEK